MAHIKKRQRETRKQNQGRRSETRIKKKEERVQRQLREMYFPFQ